MKLSNKEYTLMCQILETRGYRYGDDEEQYKGSKELKLYENIRKRIEASKENSSQRYTKEQKDYLISMLEDFELTYSENEEELADSEMCRDLINRLENNKVKDL